MRDVNTMKETELKMYFRIKGGFTSVMLKFNEEVIKLNLAALAKIDSV